MTASPSRIDRERPLTPRQQRFVQEILVDGVVAAAARRAGYSAKSSLFSRNQVMKNPKVLAAIAAERARRAAPMTREGAIAALRQIAEANVLDYARPGADGALELDLWRLERDRAGAVKALSVVEKTDPKSGAVTRTVGFTLADRSAALMKLLPMLAPEADEAAVARGRDDGVAAVAALSVEQFGRFRAALDAAGGGAAAAGAVLAAFAEREARAPEAEAVWRQVEAVLAAGQAELDALARQLAQEREDIDFSQALLTRESHNFERRRAEAAAQGWRDPGAAG